MAAEKLDYAGFLETTSESLDNNMANMKKPTLILNSWQHLYLFYGRYLLYLFYGQHLNLFHG